MDLNPGELFGSVGVQNLRLVKTFQEQLVQGFLDLVQMKSVPIIEKLINDKILAIG